MIGREMISFFLFAVISKTCISSQHFHPHHHIGDVSSQRGATLTISNQFLPKATQFAENQALDFLKARKKPVSIPIATDIPLALNHPSLSKHRKPISLTPTAEGTRNLPSPAASLSWKRGGKQPNYLPASNTDGNKNNLIAQYNSKRSDSTNMNNRHNRKGSLENTFSIDHKRLSSNTMKEEHGISDELHANSVKVLLRRKKSTTMQNNVVGIKKSKVHALHSSAEEQSGDTDKHPNFQHRYWGRLVGFGLQPLSAELPTEQEASDSGNNERTAALENEVYPTRLQRLGGISSNIGGNQRPNPFEQQNKPRNNNIASLSMQKSIPLPEGNLPSVSETSSPKDIIINPNHISLVGDRPQGVASRSFDDVGVTSPFLKRSLGQSYDNPVRIFTLPVESASMSRLASFRKRRIQSRRANRDERNGRNRLGINCNLRRVTREMLLEYFLTGKMCGSSVVRIRFGLGR